MTKYLRLNVSAFLGLWQEPISNRLLRLGNINCFLFCSGVFFFGLFVWFFVTYDLAGEKATYLKCGRFDVAYGRNIYACQKGQHERKRRWSTLSTPKGCVLCL